MEENTIWKVRQSVYQHFTNQHCAPNIADLVADLGLPEESIRTNLLDLANKHHTLTYSASNDQISMAWPFSATPTDYPVDTPGGRIWSNCAWDALSIPHLVQQDAESQYACPDCEEPIKIVFKNGLLEKTDAVVHFSVAPKVFFDDLGCI